MPIAPPEQGISSTSASGSTSSPTSPAAPARSASSPPGDGPQHLVTLASVEDDGLGEELQVVWEIEPGATVIEKVALPEPTGFDPPDQLDAFLDAVRWGAASPPT